MLPFFHWTFIVFTISMISYTNTEGDIILSYKTTSCPKNQLEWDQRADALNCSKEGKGYMCVPGGCFKELFEFCYEYYKTVILKGRCVFLNERKLDLYDCLRFESGCPGKIYHTDELFKYPNCTAINDGCFQAEPMCPRNCSSKKSEGAKYMPAKISSQKSNSGTIIAITILIPVVIIALVIAIMTWRYKKEGRSLECCVYIPVGFQEDDKNRDNHTL